MFIVKSKPDDGSHYYWNSEKAWLTNPEQATRFPTAGAAVQDLAKQRENSGEPLNFVCEISIERERD